jgi:hypothetical protein
VTPEPNNTPRPKPERFFSAALWVKAWRDAGNIVEIDAFGLWGIRAGERGLRIIRGELGDRIDDWQETTPDYADKIRAYLEDEQAKRDGGAILNPDLALFVSCRDARAAVYAYNEFAEQEEPGDLLPQLFEDERRRIETVALTRACTPRGIAEKALLLDECAETTETVGLALSLAEDALALVKAMVGAGSPSES